VVGVPAVLAGVVEGQDLKLLMPVDTPAVTAQPISLSTALPGPQPLVGTTGTPDCECYIASALPEGT
jgi:hypothetical protein